MLAVALGSTVYLWDAVTSSIEELLTVDEQGPVTSVSWAPDGKYLAVGFNNSDVQLWDAQELRQVHSNCTTYPCMFYEIHKMNEWRMDDIVELSSNAIGLFVESWIPFDFTLVVLHTISIIYI